MYKKFASAFLMLISSVFMIKVAILSIGLFALMWIFPLPLQVLPILMVVNILFALTILIVVLLTRKTSDFSFLPLLLLVSNLFSMVVFYAVPRSILTMRAEFDEANRSIYFLLANYEKTVHLIIGSAIFIIIIAIGIIMSIKTAIRVVDVAARFHLNSMKEEVDVIKTKLSSGEINEEEADSRKWAILKELDTLLYWACRFISCNVKLSLFYVGVSTVGGILIDILLNHKFFNEAAITYIPLSIFSIICLFSTLLFPSLLVLFAAKIAIAHSGKAYLMLPDPLLLELGYGLIPLVDRDKGAELLELIQSIRRESARDLGLVIPPIRIIDNMRLEPSEYCIKIKGVDVGRGKIRMGADSSTIIATHLTEIIKRHAAEIRE